MAVPEAKRASKGRLINLPGLYIVDPQHAWATNPNDGSVYGTTDGGQSWHKLASDVGQVTAMSFVDDANGWLLNSNGFQRTFNGGHTWHYTGYIYPHE